MSVLQGIEKNEIKEVLQQQGDQRTSEPQSRGQCSGAGLERAARRLLRLNQLLCVTISWP